MFKKTLMPNKRTRSGSVCVEFALVAPIFLMMIFGGIEFARVHMIQCAVENACFEGARRGIVPGATSSVCQTTVENLLDAAGVTERTVTVSPISTGSDMVTVSASVPLIAANGFGVSGFMGDRSLSKSISLPRN